MVLVVVIPDPVVGGRFYAPKAKKKNYQVAKKTVPITAWS
jgi:hypothetical protein